MGIVSSAKFGLLRAVNLARKFQSPMGIVSSAKASRNRFHAIHDDVSIPDGDSFLREVRFTRSRWIIIQRFQSPMGIVSSAKLCMP